ncbi:MAG: hypothetical protein LBP64_08985 [Tannerella sp.]|jgi:hypothetical protein|nr:hypothetical protein [Tannerella sp.]
MNMEFIMMPAVMWILVTGFYKIIELYARRRERMMIIEKFGDKFDPALFSGMSPDFLGPHRGKSFGALKFGCLLVSIGLGLLVGMLISSALTANGYDGNEWQNRHELSTTAYSASVLLFGGAGLLAAFLIEIKMRNKEKQQ